MCVLRAAGADFDVDAFLATSSLEACATFEKGQLRFLTKPDGKHRDRSGFNADVSMKEWSDLDGQIQDAKAFVSANEDELRRLRAFPGVELVELDFPIYLRIGTNDVAVQSDRLPADLLLAAGSLGIDIVVTVWPDGGPSDVDTRS